MPKSEIKYSNLQRIPIKYIRDYIKKWYVKSSKCYICKSKDKLELHHMYSVSELFHNWCEENNITEISSVDEMETIRTKFVKNNEKELSNKYLFTLCKICHERLHHIYSQRYPNRMVPKILRWIEKQRDKWQSKTE